jgi:hypothetical protein
MSKVKPTRSLLTWDEIRKIEKDWKHDVGGPAHEDIKKLIRHIRFTAALKEKK